MIGRGRARKSPAASGVVEKKILNKLWRNGTINNYELSKSAQKRRFLNGMGETDAEKRSGKA